MLFTTQNLLRGLTTHLIHLAERNWVHTNALLTRHFVCTGDWSPWPLGVHSQSETCSRRYAVYEQSQSSLCGVQDKTVTCCYEKPVWKICDLVQGKDRVFTLNYDVLIVAVRPAVPHAPMERIYGGQDPHRRSS